METLHNAIWFHGWGTAGIVLNGNTETIRNHNDKLLGLKTDLQKNCDFNELFTPSFDYENPIKTFHTALEVIYTHKPSILIGSSTGGWWANFFGKLVSIPVVLINPLVDIMKLSTYLGVSTNYVTAKEIVLNDMNEYFIFDEFYKNNLEYTKRIRTGLIVAADDDCTPSHISLNYAGYGAGSSLDSRATLTRIVTGGHRWFHAPVITGVVSDILWLGDRFPRNTNLKVDGNDMGIGLTSE